MRPPHPPLRKGNNSLYQVAAKATDKAHFSHALDGGLTPKKHLPSSLMDSPLPLGQCAGLWTQTSRAGPVHNLIRFGPALQAAIDLGPDSFSARTNFVFSSCNSGGFRQQFQILAVQDLVLFSH